MKKIITNVFLLFIFFWLSFSFFSSASIFFNPFLAIFVYLLMFSGQRIQSFWFLGSGILFDLFSPLPFGTFLVVFSLLYLIGAYLVDKFFTNRAFSTLILLTFVINILFLILLWLEKMIFNLFNSSTAFVWNWNGIFVQILINLAIGGVLFGVTKFFSNTLRLNAIGR